jgi:hypothetical protein
MKPTQPPQFELPTVSREVFNLIVETAVDGERVQHEREAAGQRSQEARELEKQQQPPLL